jgi:hypothetical protein
MRQDLNLKIEEYLASGRELTFSAFRLGGLPDPFINRAIRIIDKALEEGTEVTNKDLGIVDGFPPGTVDY